MGRAPNEYAPEGSSAPPAGLLTANLLLAFPNHEEIKMLVQTQHSVCRQIERKKYRQRPFPLPCSPVPCRAARIIARPAPLSSTCCHAAGASRPFQARPQPATPACFSLGGWSMELHLLALASAGAGMGWHHRDRELPPPWRPPMGQRAAGATHSSVQTPTPTERHNLMPSFYAKVSLNQTSSSYILDRRGRRKNQIPA